MLPPRRVLATLAVVGALLALGACGRDDASPPEDVSGEPPAAWDEASVPIERGPDTELLTAVDGDQIVMLTASDGGDVRSAVATGDGPFEPGAVLATGSEYLQLGGLARFDGAWWAVGPGGTRPVPSRPDDWELSFDLHVVTSSDGLTWTEVDATGLDGPATVTAMAATDDGLVAIGHDESANLDGGDPTGGFAPRAWRSANGTTWEPVEVPAAGARFSPSDLVEVDDGLLAIGSVDDGTVAWRSDDGGATWTEAEVAGLDEGVQLSAVEPFADGLLASGTGGVTEETEAGAPSFLARSTDGGASWTEIDAPPSEGGEGHPAAVFVADDRVFTLVDSFFDPFADPLVCYADISQCEGGSEAVLYEGDGEGSWSRLDLAELGLDEHQRIDGLVATDDRLVLWSAAEDEVHTWSTAADATLATEPEPELVTADVPMLDEGEEPEVGVRYAAPLYTHCGMDWLYLGEEPWQRTDDGADVSNGGMIYGFATLTDDDTVEYSLEDGEVVATYGPPTREPDLCA